jgi:hypothetical protein
LDLGVCVGRRGVSLHRLDPSGTPDGDGAAFEHPEGTVMAEQTPTAIVLEFTLTQNAEADIRNPKMAAIHTAIREAYVKACIDQDVDGICSRRLRSMTPKRFEAWGRKLFREGWIR